MWKVLGFKIREAGGKKYCDIFLAREAEGVIGQEVKRGNYSMSSIDYQPAVGDTVVISEGVYNNRIYISDIVKF